MPRPVDGGPERVNADPPASLRRTPAEHAAGIAEAATRIAPHVRRTPLLATDLGPDVWLKPECLQVTGAFKARGAVNAVLALREREPEVPGVITVSSGNHAQALAFAASLVGIPATVLIPTGANRRKVAATIARGAEVITQGVDNQNREERLRAVQAERGLALVHPFDDWDVIHGQATATAEALADRPDTALVVAPVGGGGLLTGACLAARAHREATGSTVRVIGVEPAAAGDAAATLASGSLVRLDRAPATIADGVRTPEIGARSFEVLVNQGLVDGIVTVEEDEILWATAIAWRRTGLLIEPTGALPIAALLGGHLPAVDGPTVLIVSGGNVDPLFVSWLTQADDGGLLADPGWASAGA